MLDNAIIDFGRRNTVQLVYRKLRYKENLVLASKNTGNISSNIKIYSRKFGYNEKSANLTIIWMTALIIIISFNVRKCNHRLRKKK